MLRIFAIALSLVCALPVFSQFAKFAPDLRWEEGLRAYLGMVNPQKSEMTVHVTGFHANGEPAGEKEIVLGPFARIEAPAEGLFAEGETPAWARVTAAVPIAGYVRYEDGSGGRSMAPLASGDGDAVWVSQLDILDGVYAPETALINVSEAEGGATLDPVVLDLETELFQKKPEPLALPDFGAPSSKTFLRYNEFFKNDERLLWDTVTAAGGARLAALKHLRDVTGQNAGMAAFALPRTPNRDMVMIPMLPTRADIWNKLVLINTYAVKIRLEMTAFYEFGVSYTDFVDLAPFEKLVYDVNHPTQLELPANAAWYRIIPHEGGLIGFNVFGSKSQGSLDGAEAAVFPASVSVLPHTPTNDQLQTDIGLLNLSEEDLNAYVVGFNDDGRIQAVKANLELAAGEKKLWSVEDLFGERAARITWVRAAVNRGAIVAYSVTRPRGGGDLTAFQGIPSQAFEGMVFEADFEHLREITLDGQGWGGHVFSLPLRERDRPPDFGNYLGFNPVPGTFFAEAAFDGDTGYFFLGYEPLYSTITTFQLNRAPDSVAYCSPWIEIPAHGSYYLSYALRMFNPQLTTQDSRYGLVWRQEGSNEWHWLGVDGILLMNPPVQIADCWVEIRYRNEIVTVTPWMPFQTKLPDTVNGKRIQIGHYYHFVPDDTTVNAPFSFIDRVEISVRPLPFSHELGMRGGGTFIAD